MIHGTKAREGDLLETQDKVIFDVKGLVHPPNRIVAFPRFIQDLHGDRKQKDIVYKKIYALSERYEFLKKQFPQYLVSDPVFGIRLCQVPQKDVKCHYEPCDYLQKLRHGSKLDELEADALHFIKLLHNSANIPWNKLGISGSLLVRLHTTNSDIDLIVYGRKNCLEVYDALLSLMQDKENPVKPYSRRQLRTLYNFRSRDTKISFHNFVKTERRKVLQGKFLQRDFFIRCVKDWNEIEEHYGDVVYRKVGYAKIKATITDDSEALFTPCHYSVGDVQVLGGKCGEAVTEITSFRGRFCEQARNGETVIVQGKVEKVQKKNEDTFFRLLLGGKPSDFMVLEK
ncbi:MAG: hypothetical protein ACE5KD_02720 [Candidatus Bathyarchaeia archaeon]